MAIIAVGGLAAAGLWTLQMFLHPIGWAAIIAMALWPSYARIAARRPGQARLLLPAAGVSLVALLFVLPLVMVGQAVVEDNAAVMQWVRDAQANGVPAPDVLAHLPWGDHLAQWWNENLSLPGGLGRIAAHGHPGSGGMLATGEKVVVAAAHRALQVVFMLLVLFFLLRDGARLGRAMQVATTRAFGAGGEKVFEQVVAAVRGTVNGLVVVGFGEGVLLGLAYELAAVPHAALLALLTGLLSAIPLGAVVAYVAAAGFLAAAGQTGWALAILVWGSLVVFVADHFVRPVLIGGSTRLPFVAVLLGIVGGIEAWGLIGLVLGPALMAALLLLWREWVGEHEGPLAPGGGSGEGSAATAL
ncbi:MAG: AI-2E family transporter [Sphingomonadales bacterium]|nr:AI-2E family transporter [Sphingomonadales bacterium]